MTKEQVYKELKEDWGILNGFMTEEDIIQAYTTITGLGVTKEQTIQDLRIYLIEYILKQVVKDSDITIEMAQEILREIKECEK